MWHFTKLQADILPGILSDILSGIISDMFTFQFHYLDLFAIYPDIYFKATICRLAGVKPLWNCSHAGIAVLAEVV